MTRDSRRVAGNTSEGFQREIDPISDWTEMMFQQIDREKGCQGDASTTSAKQPQTSARA